MNREVGAWEPEPKYLPLISKISCRRRGYLGTQAQVPTLEAHDSSAMTPYTPLLDKDFI